MHQEIPLPWDLDDDDTKTFNNTTRVYFNLEKDDRYVVKIAQERIARKEAACYNILAMRSDFDSVPEFFGLAKLPEKMRNENNVGMVLSYCPGINLNEYLKYHVVPIDTAIEILRQIILIVDHIHKVGVTHGDLYYRNFIVSLSETSRYRNSSVKVTLYDFEFGKVLSPKNIDSYEKILKNDNMRLVDMISGFVESCQAKPIFKFMLKDLRTQIALDERAPHLADIVEKHALFRKEHRTSDPCKGFIKFGGSSKMKIPPFSDMNFVKTVLPELFKPTYK